MTACRPIRRGIMDTVGILFLHCNNHAVAQVADSHSRAFTQDQYLFGCGWKNTIWERDKSHSNTYRTKLQLDPIGITNWKLSRWLFRFGVNLRVKDNHKTRLFLSDKSCLCKFNKKEIAGLWDLYIWTPSTSFQWPWIFRERDSLL